MIIGLLNAPDTHNVYDVKLRTRLHKQREEHKAETENTEKQEAKSQETNMSDSSLACSLLS